MTFRGEDGTAKFRIHMYKVISKFIVIVFLEFKIQDTNISNAYYPRLHTHSTVRLIANYPSRYPIKKYIFNWLPEVTEQRR